MLSIPHDLQAIEQLSPTAQRLVLETIRREHRAAPESTASLAAIIDKTGTWADFFGIADQELVAIDDAATTLFERGKIGDAKKVWEYLAAMDGLNPVYPIRLGVIDLQNGQIDDALAHFTQAIENRGGDLGAYAGRATALWLLGEGERAIDDTEKALEYDPNGENPLTYELACVIEDLSNLDDSE